MRAWPAELNWLIARPEVGRPLSKDVAGNSCREGETDGVPPFRPCLHGHVSADLPEPPPQNVSGSERDN